MAAMPAGEDIPAQVDNWVQEDQNPVSGGIEPDINGASLTVEGHDPELPQDYARASSTTTEATFREKQVKPNKVYIGGLPEHTRQEDLQSCFGKIGVITNIELKVGYGFVEFETREAAEESVAKYHEGFFMGNKIRVELSHGGGRTAKYAGEPGACFKCGQMGHWARECPNSSGQGNRRNQNHELPLADRLQRDYNGYPPRPLPPRDDYPPRFPPRDNRYDYPPPPAVARDYRRPPSPRDYRDYGPPPPGGTRAREYDDYRRGPPLVTDRERYPPPPPPPADFRGRYPPPDPAYRGYPPPPPPMADYERYDRRPNDRGPPPFPPGYRSRSPPRPREDYDRPPRDYSDYRGRPASPVRYAEYGRVGAEPTGRYRRRSESPRPGPAPGYDAYPMNGYATGPVPPAPGPPRGSRDYPPPPRSVDPVGSYRRP
ncbi:hypothetical protein CPB83DRAFT_842259 [Crepidotus variabilis]|uniref:RNA-binding domain-containing protein n=1 Tax=Crepidotus variabilis TaxID=179855 RepID=A0A9P6JVR3_9AGAR|nr:hypothetical protein CPB83DRAFT_842259 [Crepidotus variabilis]